MSVPKVKAVVFDMGGVCTPSPMPFLRDYSIRHQLPPSYISYAISLSPAWATLERGEIPLGPEFYKLFTEDLKSPSAWSEFHLANITHPASPPPFPEAAKNGIDGEAVILGILHATNALDPGMLRVINLLRHAGIKTGAITNDIRLTPPVLSNLKREAELWVELKDLFDVWISSSIIGIRKPDRRIFELCLKDLGVKAEEAVFLDDIVGNLKGAEEAGMGTVLVGVGRGREAVERLEGVCGVRLVGGYDGEERAML
ncbi:HAD-like protein [Ascobolus immersus RN42]|uniref:HAD-like protein n=1 Tax=Ascobolus immersus RN42 TaxID=1160509 RepID=A0A3N4IIK9_ASCIM|nr:HAD-like protein [Ascobolus immersus RN42]